MSNATSHAPRPFLSFALGWGTVSVSSCPTSCCAELLPVLGRGGTMKYPQRLLESLTVPGHQSHNTGTPQVSQAHWHSLYYYMLYYNIIYIYISYIDTNDDCKILPNHNMKPPEMVQPPTSPEASEPDSAVMRLRCLPWQGSLKDEAVQLRCPWREQIRTEQIPTIPKDSQDDATSLFNLLHSWLRCISQRIGI